jgi:hypothetical protein
VRRRRGEVLEVGASFLGALTVDGLDPDQGAMTLTAARLSSRTTHLVAGTELAAADLRGRDVDVSLGLVQTAQAQKAIALRHPVEHPGDRLRGGLVRFGTVASVSFRLLVGVCLFPWLLLLEGLMVGSLQAGVDRLLAIRGLILRLLLALLDRLDQLVARQHPVTGHPQRSRALVKVGEMLVLQGHRAPQC